MATEDRHPSLSDPRSVAEAGERIYKEKYRDEYEKTHAGEFVAIDVLSQQAYIARTPSDALKLARDASPSGIFHLIKIGSAGAFQVSHSLNARPDWLFR
jgi:hypothetical protein